MKPFNDVHSNASTRKLTKLALTCLLITGLQTVPVATAQTNAGLVLEEVIVTARKRAESIQEVPVSVTSISAELDKGSLRRIDDLQSYTPNVYLRKQSGQPSGLAISIRGVAYSEIDKTFDPSVAVIEDGVYLGSASGSLLQNFDIDRVEILRGPQGTLHGKNTTGGVINVFRTPVNMEEWGGKAGITIGDNGRQDLKAIISGPIADNLGIKLSFSDIHSDGQVRNVNLDEDIGGDDYQSLGVTARWEPSENFNLEFAYERINDETETGTYENFNQIDDLVCQLSLAGLFPNSCQFTDPTSGPDENSTNGVNSNDSTTDAFRLTANWDIGNHEITSVTGVRDLDQFWKLEFDGSPAPFLTIDYDQQWEQFSQELRIASTHDGPIQYVAGLFYWDVDYENRTKVRDLFQTLGLIGVPGLAGLPPSFVNFGGQSQQTKSVAAFFSADWEINDEWTLTVGARYTEEEKDFQGLTPVIAPESSPPVLPVTNYSDEWDEFSPKVGVSYKPNDDIMIFASYSEGFKSGGFFGRQASFAINPVFEPEFLESYELGMKATLLDGRLIFNPTIFVNEFVDKQEQVLIPIDLTNVATVVRNAANEDIRGLELEMQYQISEAWNLRANYGYLDAEYSGFSADINGDGIVTDNDGLTPRQTPEHTFGISSTYNWDIGDGQLSAYVAYRWRDEIENLLTNEEVSKLDSISNLDASLTYSWEDDKYRICLLYTSPSPRDS